MSPHYLRQQLHADATALSTLATRLVRLLSDIRHEAAQASDAGTAEALVATSESLADTLGTEWAAVCAAHEIACDDLNMAHAYEPDVETQVSFHMTQRPEPTVSLAEVEARFKTAAE